MKFTASSLALLSVAGLATAQPHKHHHRHVHERRDVHILSRDNPTALAFEYDGQAISEQDVCSGIIAGTLKWASGTVNAPSCAPAASKPAPKPAAPVAPKPAVSPAAAKPSGGAGNNFFQAAASSHSSSVAVSSTTAAPAKIPTYAATSSSNAGSYNLGNMAAIVSKISSNSGSTKPFVDGTVKCSDFPEQYGAVPVDWMNLNGFTGVQYVPASRDNIETALPNSDGCVYKEGYTTYCSYACAYGYQKSQWPLEQGAKGQSIGGIECKSDGFLYLTNSGLSSNLCIAGSDTVEVKNEMSEIAAICRTDYPGTEDESVPLIALPGLTLPLTCPLEEEYYVWNNQPTSAQYYLNRKGIAVTDACQWSTDGSGMGNFAPITLGVGTDASGTSWLSIQSTRQNNPSKFIELDFTVEIVVEPPGPTPCFYVNKDGVGLYCSKGSPSNYNEQDCNYYSTSGDDPRGKPVPGCTTGFSTGKATYVFTES